MTISEHTKYRQEIEKIIEEFKNHHKNAFVTKDLIKTFVKNGWKLEHAYLKHNSMYFKKNNYILVLDFLIESNEYFIYIHSLYKDSQLSNERKRRDAK